MIYRLIGDTAMILHLLFLAYIALGGFVAWRLPRTIGLHRACAAYGLGVTLVRWPCPLTLLETWGRENAGQAGLPATGFIDHYLTGVIYPTQHLLTVQIAVAGAVALSWAGHLILHRRRKRHTVPNPA